MLKIIHYTIVSTKNTFILDFIEYLYDFLHKSTNCGVENKEKLM